LTALLLSALQASCVVAPPARIKPVEEVLGKGWTCYAAPDGYKVAGVVVEVTSDGKYLFDADYSSLSKEVPSAIGSVSMKSTTTLGGVVKLLESFKVVDKDTSFTADLTHKADIAVAYGGTKKQVLPGGSVETITAERAKRRLVPTSTYFVFRESHSAKSVDILVGDSVVGSLGLTAKLNQIVDVNPKIARDASSQYKLKDAYEKPLGVCTIATELVPDRQFDGNTKLKLGNIVDVPTDVVISGRK